MIDQFFSADDEMKVKYKRKNPKVPNGWEMIGTEKYVKGMWPAPSKSPITHLYKGTIWKCRISKTAVATVTSLVNTHTK